MPEIPFTQYLLPNGRRLPVFIDRPDEIHEKAMKLIEAGCHFDAEMLQTGEVSFTCERGDWVLSIKVVENGPPVLDAVDALVNESSAALNEATEMLAKGEPIVNDNE